MKVLFEILTEELPAKELLNVQNDLLVSILDKYNIDYKDVNVYYTPRRIAALFECNEFTKQVKQKIIGPPKNVCFDEKNQPTKALESFLDKNNASLDEVFFEDTKKGSYVCVFKKQALLPAKELLCGIFSEFLSSINFSKQMRWGSGDYTFLRPVHNLVLLADDSIVECSMFGKKSVSYTLGHRFLSEGKVELLSKDYIKTLQDHFVIVDQNQRKLLIKEALKNMSEEDKQYILDEDLLNEVTNLVEYPHCIEATFEEEFLNLPQEVLISSMKVNQKYFYSLNKNSKLTNKFCIISNIITDDDSVIAKGNERVLRARFRDAAFFYEEDLKVKLESLVDKLKNMLFHKKLGTMYDRTMRLVELTEKIAIDIGAVKEVAKRAAFLSKADLLTHMVYEFPEVQGVMGSILAKKQSEGESVSKCIYEQYLPKDEVYPQSLEGMALSLADKFDLIVGGMIADLKPTGNKDPYGLRRAALSIIKIVLKSKLSLNIKDTVKFALSLYEKQGLSNNVLDDTLEFIKVRFLNMFEEHTEIVKSVVEVDFSDIYEAFLKVEALKTFYTQADEQDLFSIKRVFNIVPDGFDKTDVDDTLFVFDEEVIFYNYVKALKHNLVAFLQNKDYLSYLNHIVDKGVISSFFDKVLIMDKDEKVKNNRLALLNNYRQLVLKVADFKYLSI